ncbi:MAG: hypothetical protein ACW99G_06130 [Candidatus Thorarchaeota archaeon]|jgi:hypothetical protein
MNYWLRKYKQDTLYNAFLKWVESSDKEDLEASLEIMFEDIIEYYKKIKKRKCYYKKTDEGVKYILEIAFEKIEHIKNTQGLENMIENGPQPIFAYFSTIVASYMAQIRRNFYKNKKLG